MSFCKICGSQKEVSLRGKCADCAKKAMQEAQRMTCIKMIIKIRRAE